VERTIRGIFRREKGEVHHVRTETVCVALTKERIGRVLESKFLFLEGGLFLSLITRTFRRNVEVDND